MKTSLIACSLLLTIPALAAETCRPVFGLIQLTPDADCQVVKAYPGNAYLGAQRVPGTCFKTQALGLGNGFSGLTMESVFGLDQGHTTTPGVLNEKDAPPLPSDMPLPQTRQMFTGRTVIKTAQGDIYSADAGTMSAKGSTEQAIIVGGTGRYQRATGHIYAFGDYIGSGKWGTYTGQLCTPR